jgi:crossover junction endodeoxyribonuclease RusA
MPYQIYLPLAGRKWINANQRLFWMERSRRTKEWRELARAKAVGLNIPRLPGGRVVCELRFADARRRDPANWAPTAKAAIDGLVDAGVFVDDSHKYVVGPDMRIGATTIGAGVGMQLFIHPWETLQEEP